MKLILSLSLISLTLGQLVIQQQQQDGQIVESKQELLESLNSNDFISIQQSIKEAFTKADSKIKRTKDQDQPLHHQGPSHLEEEGANHGILDFSQYTILEILELAKSTPHKEPESVKSKWNLPSWGKKPQHKTPTSPAELPLGRLAYLVSKSEIAQKDLTADDITLLAPTNWALTPPSHRRGGKGKEHGRKEHHDHKHGKKSNGEEDQEMSQFTTPHPFHSRSVMELAHQFDSVVESDDNEEEKKERINKIIGYILRYHTLDGAQNAHELAGHATLPTTLNSGRDSVEPLRIRVAPSYMFWPIPHPTLKFNFYSNKVGYTIKAKNGVIHMVSAPLLPPFSPLNSLFLFPQAFSTLTSGLQKVNLDEVLLPSTSSSEVELTEAKSMIEEVMAELIKESGGAFTIFAPTNFAFTRLGPKIVAFLHSPFPISKKVLKYVLSYHLVPDIIFHSDYNTISDEFKVGEEFDVEYNHHHEKQSSRHLGGNNPFSAKWELPSKLPTPPPMKSWWPFKSSPTKAEHHHGFGHGDREHNNKANVTHYVLPTLLSATGQNSNATLKVAVYTYRIKESGPIRRAIVVLPHAKEEYEGTSTSDRVEKVEQVGKKHGCHGKRDGGREEHSGPERVYVFKADAVARNGAIHVVNTLLRPPYNHNYKKEDGMKHGINQLFAH